MIIITGGAGFIGSVLAEELNARGYDDILIVDQDMKNTAKEANLANLNFRDYLESDEFLKKIEGNSFKNVEAIFHQGACSSTTEMNLDYLRTNNTEYTERLALWAVRNNAYFSYASSAATYGNGECGYDDADDLSPKLKPLNPYGDSKLAFDLKAIDSGLIKEIIGFRYFNVYGPKEYHKEGMRSVVHKGFEQIRDTGQIKLFKSYKEEYPDGGQKRDFVYIKDVCNALLWFYENQKHKGIFNIGTGLAATWNDLANGLFAAMQKPANIDYIEMPDSIKNQYQYFTEAKMDKLRATGCPTEFRPIHDGINDYVVKHLL
ncbi:MAG: ADP-L-glycero-D-manno-heptose 6-epimerase [Candidatus Omnitrophota bacterium]|jgi:ADP-L-glycero-D-manno-heptose 6-epimerase